MKQKKHFEIIDFVRGDDIVISFIDLCHFTSMVDHAIRYNWEKDIITILNNFYKFSADTIYENGGIVDKYLGDGIMALYGSLFNEEFQISSRDFLLKAIEVSLIIESYINTLGKNIKKKLSLSSGIWMGNVFVGISSDEEKARDISVIGDPVNISARLQKYALPDEIIIPFIHDMQFKEKLDKLIKPYGKMKYYEKIQVRGKEKPINVFRIMNEDIYWEKYAEK